MAQDFVNAVLALSPVAFWPAIATDLSGNGHNAWADGNANACDIATGMLFIAKNNSENTALTTSSGASKYRKYSASGDLNIFAAIAAGTPITLSGVFSSSSTSGWATLAAFTAAGGAGTSEIYIDRNYGNDPRYFGVRIYDSAGHLTVAVFTDDASDTGWWRTGEKAIWHLRIEAGFYGSGAYTKVHFGINGVDMAYYTASCASAANGTFTSQTANARWLLGAYPTGATTNQVQGGDATHQGLAYWERYLSEEDLESIITGACYDIGGVGVGLGDYGDYDAAEDASFHDHNEVSTIPSSGGYGAVDLIYNADYGDAPVYLTDPLGRRCYDFRSVEQNASGRQTCLVGSGVTAIRPARCFHFAVAALTSHAVDTSYNQGRFITTYDDSNSDDIRYLATVVGRANGVVFNTDLKEFVTASMARGIPSISVFVMTTGLDGRIKNTVPRFILDDGATITAQPGGFGDAPDKGLSNGTWGAVHNNLSIGCCPRAAGGVSTDGFVGRIYRFGFGSRQLSATALVRLQTYLKTAYPQTSQTVPVTVWGTSIECAHNIDDGDGYPYSNAGWVQDFAPAWLIGSLDLVNCATGLATLDTITNLDPSKAKWYARRDGTVPARPIVIIEPFTNNIYAGTAASAQLVLYTDIVGLIRTACPDARIVLVYMPLTDGANGHETIRDDLHAALVADPTLYDRMVTVPAVTWVHPANQADSRIIASAVWGEVADMLAGSPVKFLLLLD